MGRKFKWFVVERYTETQYRDEYEPHVRNPQNYHVVRAVDKHHAAKVSFPFGFGCQNETYSCAFQDVISEHETKKEAEAEMKRLQE